MQVIFIAKFALFCIILLDIILAIGYTYIIKVREDDMKVIADTINGVQKVDSFDDVEATVDVLDEAFFYDYLKGLGDDELIGADISDEMAEKIRATYGITD